MKTLKKMSPGRLIVLGFATVITLGAITLLLPFSIREGGAVPVIDAFFTSTSAVCVTGLASIDPGNNLTNIGQAVLAMLIQIGGLGVTSVGVGLILLARRKVTFKDRILIKESMGLESMKGVVRFVKAILLTTLCFESVGALLSFIVFSKTYPPIRALGISVFHAVSAFNNAGFDVLGGFKNLADYKDNVLLNLTTCGLIIFGGLGFLVIQEIIQKRSFKKFSLHAKTVILMTITLLASGTVLLWLTEDVTWLGAFFFSTSARTAGFSTYAVGGFTSAGLLVLVVLMFIGASPGSTGGGIKTTTAYTIIKNAISVATNKHCTTMKRKIPSDVVHRALTLMSLALTLVIVSTFLLCIFEPQFSFMQCLFEVVSAFGTVGLSTGITSNLTTASKVVIILTMFCGRCGPLTMVSIWSFKPLPDVSYSEESIPIG